MALELVEWDLDWWNGTWTGGMGLELMEWDLNWWNGTWTGGMGLGLVYFKCGRARACLYVCMLLTYTLAGLINWACII